MDGGKPWMWYASPHSPMDQIQNPLHGATTSGGSDNLIAANACHDISDDSFKLQQIYLAILPSIILLLIVPLRLWGFIGQKQKVGWSPMAYFKLIFYVLLGSLQASLLAIWTLRSTHACPTPILGITASALGLADAIALAILSYLNHTRSIKPSTIITVYLLLATAGEGIICTKLWHTATSPILAPVYTATMSVKAFLFILESQTKRSILLDKWQQAGPEATSGIFGRAFFWWVNPLLAIGYKGKAPVSSAYTLDNGLESEKLSNQFIMRWAHRNKSAKRPLLRTLFSFGKWSILSCVPPRLLVIGFKICQPLLISEILEYLSDDHAKSSTPEKGYNLIFFAAFSYIGLAISESLFERQRYRQATKINGALSCYILDQAVDLRFSNQGEGALTLVTSDVDSIYDCFNRGHDLWGGSLEFLASTILLQRQVGWGCIGPVGMVFLSSVLMSFIGKRLPGQQMAWSKMKQNRVSITSRIIGSMKEVKLLGLVGVWFRNIQDLMDLEITQSQRARTSMSFMNLIGNMPHFLSPLIAFGIALATSSLGPDGKFSLKYVFTTVSILNMASGPLAMILFAFPEIIRALAAFERVEKYFITAEESRDLRNELPDGSHNESFTDNPGSRESSSDTVFHIEHATFKFNVDDTFALQDINLRIPEGSFTMAVGKVGSGKTALLNALLGELISTGVIRKRVKGGISYCPQSAWLFNGTIRHNIVAESVFDQEWYDLVIRACGLDVDFAELDKGDESPVGSKGITLSGGQKHRVNLARALYARNSLLIIDDVMSGLDWTTQAHIWSQVFGPKGLLRKYNRTVILATHHLTNIQDADHIVVFGDNGKISLQGSFESLEHTESFAKVIANRKHGSSSETSTQVEESAPAVEEIKATLKIAATTAVSPSQNTADRSLYGYYLKHLKVRHLIMVAILGCILPLTAAGLEFWRKFWAEAAVVDENINHWAYFGVYALLSVVALSAILVDIWFIMVVLMPQSTKGIHQVMLRTLMNAPLGYFTNTDAGDILSRFSKDIAFVDSTLSGSFMRFWFTLRGVILSTILVLPGSTYIVGVIPFSIVVVYLVQKYYLPTSRELRVEKIQETAPLSTQLLETIDGLVTIRAFGWRDIYRTRSSQVVDRAQKPHYLLLSVQQWLTLVLDLYAASIGVCLVSLGILLPNSTSTGFMGIALNNFLYLSWQLSALISGWTHLETSLGAISRIKDFELNTPAETAPEHPEQPPSDWPSQGQLEFSQITASYSKEEDDRVPVVNKISFAIKPAQKVAICGRTGSGKSSLVLTLFRLLELDSGSITLDGINLGDLTQNEIRERLIAIPQEPTLFPGTLRSNLWQPLTVNSPSPTDDEIKLALDKVGMLDVINSQGGLDKESSETTLSQGQKQLLCLCRAILRKGESNVLVLDEAMSAVDGETEEIMVRVLETEFANHTVLSVAHRLNTVRKFDLVAVLDHGKLVEVGNPEELLNSDSSKFKAMWNAQR